MKKNILMALLLVATIGVSAQNLAVGSLDFLNGETEISIAFDYSQLKISGQAEKSYALLKNESWGTNWENAKKTAFIEKFIRSLNSELVEKNLSFDNLPTAKYLATIKVLTLDNDWNMNTEVIFTRQNESKTLAVLTLKGKAGRFGSDTNLTGDAMCDAGKKLGKFLAKKIR